MNLENVLPMDIEKRSFEIITEELGQLKLDPEKESIIKRVIHTSADFDYARTLRFSEGVVEQTLEILFGPVEHRVDPDFREVDFGAFEMGSYEELKDNPAYQAWLEGDNESNVPPGGESGVQMKARVLTAFSRLQEDTVVITHGGVIAAVMEACFPEEQKNRYLWQPKPGHGYAIRDGRYWAIPEEE